MSPVNRGVTHGKAAAKDERANEFAASADAEYRGYWTLCQYTEPDSQNTILFCRYA